jgi:hypothetical protein
MKTLKVCTITTAIGLAQPKELAENMVRSLRANFPPELVGFRVQPPLPGFTAHAVIAETLRAKGITLTIASELQNFARGYMAALEVVEAAQVGR